MALPESLEAYECAGFEPRMFVVNHAAGEKLAGQVRDILDPVDVASMHFWALAKDRFPELHFHDNDEYWAWVAGRTVVTIRLPDGRSDQVEVGPGAIVYCVRGVEHCHKPLEDWCCYEWTGVQRPRARPGHLTREL